MQFLTFHFRHSARSSRGFTTTPISVPSHFPKIFSGGTSIFADGSTMIRKSGETKKQHQNWCRGFTPTPNLASFRFVEVSLFRLFTVVQKLILLKDGSETKKQHQNWCRGFTLIELIVVIAIFTVMTGVVLAKYNTYNSNAPFANASEDIVLSLRQAQVYGVGVKKGSAGCSTGVGAFECPYGVYFSKDSTERSGLIIFADANGDRVYNLGEEVERISWKNTIQIGTICLDSICTFTKSNITFRRPDPSAFVNDTIPSLDPLSVYDLATITLNNTVTGATSVVTISKAGQISID